MQNELNKRTWDYILIIESVSPRRKRLRRKKLILNTETSGTSLDVSEDMLVLERNDEITQENTTKENV